MFRSSQVLLQRSTLGRRPPFSRQNSALLHLAKVQINTAAYVPIQPQTTAVMQGAANTIQNLAAAETSQNTSSTVSTVGRRPPFSRQNSALLHLAKVQINTAAYVPIQQQTSQNTSSTVSTASENHVDMNHGSNAATEKATNVKTE